MTMKKRTIAMGLLSTVILNAPSSAEEKLVVLRLTPAEIVAVIRAMDRQPIAESPPDEFWDLQIKIGEALGTDANFARILVNAAGEGCER